MSEVVDALYRVADGLDKAAPLLNELDGVAGDGDLGVTMAHVARVLRVVVPDNEASWFALLALLGETLEREASSTAGTLLATALSTAVARVSAEGGDVVAQLASGTRIAAATISQLGGAVVGQRTMLDGLAPAADALRHAADEGKSIDVALTEAAKAADAGALETRTMVPQFGRAGWIPHRALGHEDAGARLIAIIFAALSRGINP